MAKTNPTVISFLGRVTPKKDAPNVAAYNEAIYRFNDGFCHTQRSFVGALLVWLSQQSRSAGQIIVAGTAGSMWGALQDLFASHSLTEDALNLLISIEQSSLSSSVTQSQLDKLAELLGQHLQAKVRLLIIGACQSMEEQLQLVYTLAEEISSQSKLILDITHSFRHLPLLGVAAAHYLRHTKRCTLDAVYYGMFEQVGPDKAVPVVDLSGMLRIFEVSESLASLSNVGTLSPLARLLGNDLPDLEKTAFFLGTWQTGSARRPAQALLRDLGRSDPPLPPLIRVASAQLRSQVQFLSSQDSRLHDRQIESARQALGRDDFLTAASMLSEALSTIAVLRYGEDARSRLDNPNDYAVRQEAIHILRNNLPSEDRIHSERLRELRNALIHSLNSHRSDVQIAMGSRKNLQKFLRKLYDWTKQTTDRLLGDMHN